MLEGDDDSKEVLFDALVTSIIGVIDGRFLVRREMSCVLNWTGDRLFPLLSTPESLATD